MNRDVALTPLLEADWPEAARIYAEAIEEGEATFETEVPAWAAWDAAHHPFGRIAARLEGGLTGFGALAPVSARACYAGVAEASVYVARAARRGGVGRALLEALIEASEANGIWTLQGATFAENEASLRLQTACGFRIVGCRERIARLHGRWRDTVLTERRSNQEIAKPDGSWPPCQTRVIG